MRKLYLIIAVLLVGLVAAGCGMWAQAGSSRKPAGTYVSPNPAPAATPDSRTVTLYFADFQAQYVMPEQRKVVPGERSLPAVVVDELLKGPEDPYLHRGIPAGITINGVNHDPASGTVVVDFSRSLIDKFPGGSAGSSMFFGSLIFSLTDLEGVEQVAITVEGQTPEYLDQVEISGAATRGPTRTYPVFIDQDRARWLQQETEQGRQAWRLDPLKVAQFDGKMFGFTSIDQFKLISRVNQGEYSGIGEARVEAIHDGQGYIIELIQPVKSGEKGIWLINSIWEK